MPNDLTGQTFNKLFVLQSTKQRKSGCIVYKCQCTCPEKPIVYVASRHLISGNTKSCGCYNRELCRELGLSRKTHGASKTSSKKGRNQLDYDIWRGIKERCYNKNHKHYSDYGGKGIRLHKEWRKNFTAFARYIRGLENCPDEDLLISRLKGKRLKVTIDRIDNNRSYKPGNVKWSSKSDQANNRKSNIFVEYKGKKQTLKQACDKYAVVSYKTVHKRITAGWSLEKALLTPSCR